MSNIWILATANGEGDVITSEPTDQTAPITETGTKADGSNNTATEPEVPMTPMQKFMQFAPIIVIFIVMYFLMFRGPKKKQQQHKEMVSSLAKNARVRTIGGIFGTVIDIRDDEIVIKIDESSNTKMRVTPSAIATVLTDNKD
ncbi:MAG: preprotein translocase subunit YajC [Planctomycetota bacterium]|jgi:preprotein translocase subunit YajC